MLQPPVAGPFGPSRFILILTMYDVFSFSRTAHGIVSPVLELIAWLNILVAKGCIAEEEMLSWEEIYVLIKLEIFIKPWFKSLRHLLLETNGITLCNPLFPVRSTVLDG